MDVWFVQLPKQRVVYEMRCMRYPALECSMTIMQLDLRSNMLDAKLKNGSSKATN